MKRFKKSVLAILMTLVIVMSSLFVIPADAAEVATEGSGASITFEASGFSWPKSGTVTCYTLSNGRVNTYSDAAATKYTGYISGSTDQCTIIGYNTKYSTFQVKYPTSRGTKTAWTKWSNFIYNTSYPSKSETLDKSYTVYTKSNLSKTIGTAYKGDKVSIVSQSGNLLQIVYPVGSNWKMGWIKRTPVVTYNDVFASTKGRGYNISQGRSSASTSFTKGQYVYVWGYVHDANNNLYKSYSSGTVNMTLSIYKPNGSCAYTYTYNNSDNNWIGTTLNTTGTWKIQCKLSGSISGTNTQTITVKDSTPTYTTKYVIANSGLVLRKGAGTSYAKITTMPYGSAVQEYSRSNGWSKVTYNGNTGYCSTSYLSTPKPVINKNLSAALYNNSGAYISCGFDGYKNTKGRHEGIDVKYKLNAPIYSLTDGVVVRVANGSLGSSGLSTIAIYNSATNKTVIYLHSAPVSGLYAGKTVKKGDKIGTESWRGISSSTSSHTHVEVRNGRQGYAAKSVNDYTLDNSNPTSFWNSMGYTVK